MYTAVVDIYNGVLAEVKLFINNSTKANEYFIAKCKEIDDCFGEDIKQQEDVLTEGFFEKGPDSIYIFEPEIEE